MLVAADDFLSDLQPRLQALCEGLPVAVLRIRRERGTAVAGLTSATRETLDELSVSDVFAQRLSSESLEPEVQARLVGLYQHVVAELAEESA